MKIGNIDNKGPLDLYQKKDH